VIVPVFKTGGWQALLSPVGSTPTRFRHLFLSELRRLLAPSSRPEITPKSPTVIKHQMSESGCPILAAFCAARVGIFFV